MRPIDKIRKTKEIILIEQVRSKQILTSASVLGRNEEQGPK